MLKQLLDQLLGHGPPTTNGNVLTNQNGRAPVQVSDAELIRAREDLIRREHPRDAARAKTIRANWPIDQLGIERAEAWFNGKVLLVAAYTAFSGWRLPAAREVDLQPDADDTTLGAAVNEVLSYSRELTLHDWYGRDRQEERTLAERNANYRSWRDSLMRRHGYRTQRALFANMLHVNLQRNGGSLRFSPLNHVKLGAWDAAGIPPNSDVILGSDSAVAAIGSALRITFGRCLDTHGLKR